MPQLNFDAGHVFFRPGDPTERAFFLKSGEVEVLTGDGRRIGLLRDGDVFGEMALVEECPHAFTAKATAAGAAETLTKTEFEQSLLREPARCQQYLKRLFEHIRYLAARGSGDPEPTPAESGDTPGLKIVPLTPKAQESLRESGWVLPKLPFRVGRATGADEDEALDLNDLWILDDKPFQVSRNHMSIDRWEQGRFVVRDRGSFLGTIVNGQQIGGRSRQRIAELQPGENTVVVGSAESPYRFSVSVPAAT